jgi:hypothetical protein
VRVYHCYFLNERGRTEADENIEAHALDEAVDRALALLRQQSKHKAVEIWEGPNRLYPARRKRPGRSRILFQLEHEDEIYAPEPARRL